MKSQCNRQSSSSLAQTHLKSVDILEFVIKVVVVLFIKVILTLIVSTVGTGQVGFRWLIGNVDWDRGQLLNSLCSFVCDFFKTFSDNPGLDDLELLVCTLTCYVVLGLQGRATIHSPSHGCLRLKSVQAESSSESCTFSLSLPSTDLIFKIINWLEMDSCVPDFLLLWQTS